MALPGQLRTTPPRQSSANLSTRQAPRKRAKLDEVAVQVLQEPQHKGRQGEALVYDVHRMSVLGESLQRKPEPRFEPRSNQASTFDAQAKRRSGPCSWASASFLTSTTWTTLSGATPSPRELSVCRLCALDGVRDGEDSSATVSSSSSSEGSA